MVHIAVCSSFVTVAHNVIKNGFVKLSQAFRSAFPHIAYHSHSAKRRLLQLPLVALCVSEAKSGLSEVYLFENSSGVDYRQFLNLLNTLHFQKNSRELAMSKSDLKDILSLAKTDKERECARMLYGNHQVFRQQQQEGYMVVCTSIVWNFCF